MDSPAVCRADPRYAAGSDALPAGIQLEHRFWLACTALLYVLALHWSYANVVSVNFSYIGLDYNPSYDNPLFVYMLCVLPSCWMPVISSRPSVFIYYVLYLLVYVPSILIGSFLSVIDTDTLFLIRANLLLGFSITGVAYLIPRIDLPTFPLSRPAFWLVITTYGMLSSVYLALNLGFRFEMHALSDVYDVRDAYTDRLVNAGRLTPYFVSWHANVLAPFLIVLGATRRKFFFIILGVLIDLWVFSVTGYKHCIFSLLLLAGLLLVVRRRSSSIHGWHIFLGAALVMMLCSLADRASGQLLLSSFVTRRTITMPGFLTCAYFDFFSHNPKTLLGHGLLRGVVQYPYGDTPASIIGLSYFGTAEASANANIWADAFANFGTAGIVVYSALMAGFLWLYDSVSRKQPLGFALPLIAVSAIALSNSNLLTTLLTHGMSVALAIVFLRPAENEPPPQSLAPPPH